MNSRLVPFAALLGLLAAAPLAAEDGLCSDGVSPDLFACREILIEFDPALFDWTVTPQRFNLRLLGVLPELPEPEALFAAPPGTDVPTLIGRMLNEPGVQDAEVNKEFISPECRQWNIGVIELGPDPLRLLRAQPALQTMRAETAQPPIGRPGEGVIVAVVDTGVSRTHPLLQASLIDRGIDMISGGTRADDTGNGIDDDIDGVTDRGWGHGTAVAGLVRLIAPGARILPVRVLDDECHGTAFGIARGIIQAVQSGARVINLSLGAVDDSSTIKRAVQYAEDRGVAVVAPAGNQGGSTMQFPANRSDAYAVAAVDSFLIAPAFTAHSSKVVLVAPGVDVDAPYRHDRYARLSGTSFSTALVSGAVAAGFALAPWLSPRDVIDTLGATAIPVDPLNPQLRGELGDGVPDMEAAMRAFRAARRSRETRDRSGTAGVHSLPGRTGTILTRD